MKRSADPSPGGQASPCPASQAEERKKRCREPAVVLALPNLAFEGRLPLQEGTVPPPPLGEGSLEVLIRCASERPHLNLLLVEGEDYPSRGITEAAFRDSQRVPSNLTLHIGYLTGLKDAGHTAQVVVNPTNFRFLAKGSSVNVMVNKACGPQLENQSRLQYGTKAEETKAYPVKLVPSSPLRVEQGVQVVIQVVPPRYTPNDPTQWEAQLHATYRNVFTAFEEQVKARGIKADLGERATSSSSQTTETSPESSSVMMATPSIGDDELPPYQNPGPPTSKSGAGWGDVLFQYLQSPDKYRSSIYLDLTSQAMVIYDGYAKSFLASDGVADLRKDSLGKLKALHQLARKIRDKLEPTLGEGNKIRLGYHAIPSLKPLHLHIISQDFLSDALKKKKHYNSFTTAFFLDADNVESSLEQHGRVVIDTDHYKKLEGQDMKCHRCARSIRNMPELKQHLNQCKAPLT